MGVFEGQMLDLPFSRTCSSKTQLQLVLSRLYLHIPAIFEMRTNIVCNTFAWLQACAQSFSSGLANEILSTGALRQSQYYIAGEGANICHMWPTLSVLALLLSCHIPFTGNFSTFDEYYASSLLRSTSATATACLQPIHGWHSTHTSPCQQSTSSICETESPAGDPLWSTGPRTTRRPTALTSTGLSDPWNGWTRSTAAHCRGFTAQISVAHNPVRSPCKRQAGDSSAFKESPPPSPMPTVPDFRWIR
jgi:hypothetical protein